MTRRYPLDMCSSENVGSPVFGINGLSGRPHNELSFLEPSAFRRSPERPTGSRLAGQVSRQQPNADHRETRRLVK